MGLYSDKLWKACRLIKEYNAKLDAMKLPEGVKPPKQIDDERFVEKLVLIGGVSDELIRQCTWEELENCGLPRLLARDVAKVFRANQVDPDWTVKRWMPLLKAWRLHWRDHMDLAERLERAALDEGWHGDTEDTVEKTLTGPEFKTLLELIRDHHLGVLSGDDARIRDRWQVVSSEGSDKEWSAGYTDTREGAEELKEAHLEKAAKSHRISGIPIPSYSIKRVSTKLKQALLRQIDAMPESKETSLEWGGEA